MSTACLRGALCRSLFRRTVGVYLIRRLRLQAGVRTTVIEELDVPADPASGLADRLVGVQVHLFVLDRPPEAFHENIVTPAALAIHADGDPFFLEMSGEGFAGELRTLVGIEDFRLAIPAQSLIKRVQTERHIHGDRQLPTQHPTTEPVNDRDQIDEAALHRTIRDVC